jgi:hypothetical protein
LTVLISGQTSSSLKVPSADIWCSAAPSREKRGVMSSCAPIAMARKPVSHISGESCVHM